MTHLAHYMERMLYGLIGVGVTLVLFYAVIHVTRVNAGVVPVIGAPIATGANWVGAHTTPY